ncbi:carbohydrate ABC transporter permease [Streptomyces sp. ISL-100]|uniref:carbohydrate ABC transporter permease n=1 Tax=Streptomyces sp. ISL-100 TaxID=2819173 RepID=UPI001BEA5BAD|nr:carbohydrate ABC transporter permease [Streptomyces sp. ISL-100]MBT2395932.1 carbohydrate ABC transporter permease [Streptomyces sp. ISL-100]
MSTQTAPPAAKIRADSPAATTAAIKSRRPRRPREFTSKAVVNAVLVVFALYTLLPLTWLVIASTKTYRDLFATNPFALGDFSFFSNLGELFSYNDGVYLRWLGNSVLYTVIGSLLSTLISVVCGYAFDKYEFRGKEKLFGVVLIGLLVPSTVTALPLYLLASEVGLVNTYWAVLIPSLVNPFGVYLARVFSEGYVPGEVLEASRMDGAGELRTFGSVSLPMLAPGFMTIFLFSFTASWNNFYSALMILNDEALYPVNLGLYTLMKSVYQQPELYPLVIIGSLVAVIPLIIAFLSLQRFWRSGLTAGAVK